MREWRPFYHFLSRNHQQQHWRRFVHRHGTRIIEGRHWRQVFGESRFGLRGKNNGSGNGKRMGIESSVLSFLSKIVFWCQGQSVSECQFLGNRITCWQERVEGVIVSMWTTLHLSVCLILVSWDGFVDRFSRRKECEGWMWTKLWYFDTLISGRCLLCNCGWSWCLFLGCFGRFSWFRGFGSGFFSSLLFGLFLGFGFPFFSFSAFSFSAFSAAALAFASAASFFFLSFSSLALAFSSSFSRFFSS